MDVTLAGEVGPLHCIVGGRAEDPPVLLVHGMAGNCHWWDNVTPYLTEDFRTVALDFRGHGDSAWARPPRYEIVDYAADIESARHHFGWEKFHLVAHSMGARVAVQYAKDRPEKLASLTLVDFLADFSPKAARKFRRPARLRQPKYSNPQALLDRFRLEPDQTHLTPEQLRELGLQSIKQDGNFWTWKFDWQAFAMMYLPVWPQLPHINLPSLVIRGEFSEVMPKDAYLRVLNELRRSQGLDIPRAYHHVPLDAPRTVGETVREFLKGLPVFL